LRGPLCAAPPGSLSGSLLIVPGSCHQVWIEMVLQRPKDIGERRELLRRQRIGEMPLDRPHVRCGRAPEDARALRGQRDLSSAAVGGAVVPPDQMPPLHSAEVMGQAAAL